MQGDFTAEVLNFSPSLVNAQKLNSGLLMSVHVLHNAFGQLKNWHDSVNLVTLQPSSSNQEKRNGMWDALSQFMDKTSRSNLSYHFPP